MGMTIDELITFCEEEEQNHRVKAKRADDASGYTRSKDKNVKTTVALREEVSSWGMNDYAPLDFIDAIDQADTILEADRSVEDGKID